MANRSWFEEYLYRRTKHATPQAEAELRAPRDARRRANLILRVLGIVLPLVFCYGLGALYFGRNGNLAGYWVVRSLGAAAWLGFTAVLAVRRDWPGVAMTTVFYAFVDAWLWMTVLPA
jgi:hypothetical protein